MLRKGAKNLTGMRFGALLVMNYAGHFSCGRWKRASWACRCDCGKTKVILGGNLLNGGVRSCGRGLGEHLCRFDRKAIRQADCAQF